MPEPAHISEIIPAAVAGLKASVPALPSLVVDTREQTPLAFRNLPTVTAGLVTGDYSIAGLENDFTIERKSIPDLIGSVTGERDRFMRELQRMKAHSFRRLLVIGHPQDIPAHCRGANPRAVLASVHAIEARFCPVVWIANPQEAALAVERWAWWAWRESVKIAGLRPATPGWAVLSAALSAECQ